MTTPPSDHDHSWAHNFLLHCGDFAHEISDILERRVFVKRLIRILTVLTSLGAASIALGACGFHWTEDLSWLISFYWATMLITGCGLPVVPSSDGGKLWAIVYAFYGAAYFAGVFVAFLAPIAHNIIQRYIRVARRQASLRKTKTSDTLPPDAFPPKK